jgi:hypothetical protein
MTNQSSLCAVPRLASGAGETLTTGTIDFYSPFLPAGSDGLLGLVNKIVRPGLNQNVNCRIGFASLPTCLEGAGRR